MIPESALLDLFQRTWVLERCKVNFPQRPHDLVDSTFGVNFGVQRLKFNVQHARPLRFIPLTMPESDQPDLAVTRTPS
jgi:hypothetical protein